MNGMTDILKCSVCESSADGQHFGIKCCRACAAFFRRTTTMSLRYTCRFEKRCKVSLNMRYSCRHCRFQKCLDVGMRKEMVQNRRESRSNSERDLPRQKANPSSKDEETSDYSPQGFISDASTSSQGESDVMRHTFNDLLEAAVLPGQPAKNAAHLSADNELEETTKSILTLATYQAARDLHSNVQKVLRPYIEDLFDKTISLTDNLGTIPLTMCQQALWAYTEHNRLWTFDKLDHTGDLDMDVMMRNNYVEICYIARFCMSISTFAQLPKDQKWIVFKNFWSKFCELDRSFVTCQLLGYSPEDDRCVSLSGQVMSLRVNMVKLELITDMEQKQMIEYLSKSFDKVRRIFTNPFKKLRPTDYELIYMMMKSMWNVAAFPGITIETMEIAKKADQRLGEELHIYYSKFYDDINPNYAGRLTKITHVVSSLDEVTDLKKEESQISKVFNIFKIDTDVLFGELCDPV